MTPTLPTTIRQRRFTRVLTIQHAVSVKLTATSLLLLQDVGDTFNSKELVDYTAPMQLNDYADTHPAGITQHSSVCLAGIYTQSRDRSCMPTEGLAHCRAHHAGKPDQSTLVIATVSIPLQGRHRATADLAPVVHTAHSFVAPSTAIHPHNHPSSHTG